MAPSEVGVADAVVSEAPSVDEDLKRLILLGRRYRWAKGETRRKLERAGVVLARSDFYSETPTLDDIDRSFEYHGERPPFGDPHIFNVEKMVRLAEDLAPFMREFDPPLKDDGTGFFWSNGQFSLSDAMLLYALVRARRPSRIIEIGSGFSTHVSALALRRNGFGKLLCIDPQPRTDIESLADVEFLRKPVQEVSVDYFRAAVRPGDFVFYDGSHALKTGSDTIYFYLKILPYLPVGLLVHSHDVFLPYPMPQDWLADSKISWGESYLLMAHLHNTHRYRVLIGSNVLWEERRQFLDGLMMGRWHSGGGSLWYETRQPANVSAVGLANDTSSPSGVSSPVSWSIRWTERVWRFWLATRR